MSLHPYDELSTRGQLGITEVAAQTLFALCRYLVFARTPQAVHYARELMVHQQELLRKLENLLERRGSFDGYRLVCGRDHEPFLLHGDIVFSAYNSANWRRRYPHYREAGYDDWIRFLAGLDGLIGNRLT